MTQVVINDVVPREQFTASGGQTVFNTLFTADATTDIDVYARLSGVPADDVTQLVSSADYIVTFVGASQTTRVTFVVGRVAGDIITIVRNTPSDRENLYINTNFTPSMLNQDFGLLTLIDQQNQMYDTVVNPGYNLSATIDGVIDTILPVLEANQFWIKDNGNNAIITATLPGGVGPLPSSSPFLTYTADASLTNAFDLGLLTDGVLAQAVVAGFATPYIIDIPFNVAHGGTGVSALISYSVLIGGTTNVSPVQQVNSLGNVDDVLTSLGAGAAPTWQPTDTLPVGTIIDFGGTSTPSKYLACDGALYATATYPALFAAIGYAWGGVGANFNVPDLQGYVTAGSDGTLLPLSNAVGATGGTTTHTITIAEMPSHDHPGSTYGNRSTNAGGSGTSYGATGAINQNFPVTVAAQGSGTAMTIVQPTAIVKKCIKFE